MPLKSSANVTKQSQTNYNSFFNKILLNPFLTQSVLESVMSSYKLICSF